MTQYPGSYSSVDVKCDEECRLAIAEEVSRSCPEVRTEPGSMLLLDDAAIRAIAMIRGVMVEMVDASTDLGSCVEECADSYDEGDDAFMSSQKAIGH